MNRYDLHIYNLLEKFKQKHRLKIDSRTIDLTDTFLTEGPEYFIGKKVLGYVVYGAPLITKYKQVDGKTILKDDKPIIKTWDKDDLVISMLCLSDIRNTCFHEIYDARDVLKKGITIQGFSKEHIDTIANELTKQYSQFDPDKDTAFFLANNNPEKKLKLSKLWFNQIIQSGCKAPSLMTEREAYLMKEVLDRRALLGNQERIRKASYMFTSNTINEDNNKIHTPESIRFLEMKIASYHSFIAQKRVEEVQKSKNIWRNLK